MFASNFKAIGYFGFRTRKPPQKFGLKSRHNQKQLKYGKKYFTRLYVLRYPFIVHSSSPKPQKIDI